MTKKSLHHRSEVPIEETWNLESIFPTLEDWHAAIKEVESLIPEMESFQGQLGTNAQKLAEGLEISEKMLVLGMKIFVYTGLATSVDVGDQDAAARNGQGRSVLTKLQTANAFVEPEIMAIGFDTLQQWVLSEPKLEKYAHYFDQLELRSEYIRSAEVEEIIALTYEALPPLVTLPPYSSLTNADLIFKPASGTNGEELEVAQSSINSLITHTDREIRRTAWEHYADAYLDHKNTLASIQTMVIQRDVFNMRARGYESSLQASLQPKNIPEEVFHNLIGVFKKNLPTWHRYWRIRHKALGYNKFHVYDLKAPISETKPLIPYQQAVDWIAEGMAPLGEEYVEILRRGCTVDRWVDRARNKGKRQGAFSWGSFDTQPFIMMSYADDVFSLSTLAHELGHSLHSYYTRKTQPVIYAQYTLFVAEVASNFNQALVRDYLFRTQNDEVLQLALVEEAMSNYHRYFFIMPTLARFELEMHRRIENGEPVNAQTMIELTAELFKEGYADEVEFDHDRIGITWAQFGHMHMDFYVYQYATGIAGANALAEGVLKGNSGAAEKYLDFLKAGNSLYPLEALNLAGVDMTSPEPVEKAFAVLSDYVDRFEALVS